MISWLKKPKSEHRCAQLLVESDRLYFEMGAEVQQLSLGLLAWMPGLTELAASCVIHRVDFADTHPIPDSWLDEIEHVLRQRSVSRARVYLDHCPPQVRASFGNRGYEYRCEIGFLAPKGHPKPADNVQLSEVLTDEDWSLKQALHEREMEGPDGYANQADLWVAMERRKCATGSMRSFLVRRDNEIVATVGTIVNQGLLRLKNIVVSPQQRRRGIGVAIVHHLWQMAEVDHGCRLGVFGVQGGMGRKLYQRAGLYEVTRQFEWSRLMAGQK